MSLKKGSSVEIDVSYYKKEDKGFIQKTQEFTVKAPGDQPLQKILSKHLSQKSIDLQEDDPSYQLCCYAGDFMGESISLQDSPREILYVVDAVRCGGRPVLYLCKEPRPLGTQNGHTDDRSSLSPDFGYPMYSERQASFVCKTFMGTNGPSKTKTTGSVTDLPTKSSTLLEDDDVFDEMNGLTSPRKFHPKPILRHNRTQVFSTTDSVTTLPANVKNPFADQKKENRKTLFVFPTAWKPRSHTHDDLALEERKRGARMLKMNSDEITEQDSKQGEPPFAKPKKKLTSAKSIAISGPMSPTPPAPTPPPISDVGTKRTLKREQFRRGRQKVIRRKSTHDLDVPRLPTELEEVQVEVADNSKMLISCHNYTTVGELKATISKQLNALNESLKEKITPSHGGQWQSSDITLTYSLEGKDYELLNESQFLFNTAFQAAIIDSNRDIPIKANPVRRPSEKELSVLYRISCLTGMLLDKSVATLGTSKEFVRIADAAQQEVQWARRTLHDFVTEVTSTRSAEDYTLSMQLVTTEAPLILALKIPTDNKITIHFHYQSDFTLKRKVNVRRSADRILTEVFPCVLGCGLVDNRIEDYTLQVSGEENYIAGKNELLSFRHIRRCILKGEAIHLSVTKKPSLELDTAHEFCWFPLDAKSNEPPLHCHISSKPPISVLEASSIWDCEENFSLKVLKVENLPLTPRPKQHSVFVSATLYHGWKKLCGPFHTVTSFLESTVQWNEEIDFMIQKKNIPKAAKIMFVISEGTIPRKHSQQHKERSKPKFLYWGLLSVYNYRGILCSGNYTIQLWQGKKLKSAIEIANSDCYTVEPNPSAPATENPHSKSPRITISFDSCAKPVIFPATNEDSRSSFFKQHPAFKNVAVKRQFKTLLTCIKQGRLYRKVPSYIVGANWGNLSECLEVYSLLDQLNDVINAVPIEVVIKLLDSDFPDEKVREFAVKVLEQLPVDQLEDLLLQLTQALKFERTHDSLLARFLLKRALQNKRIGHFFFWYLKCEMCNPQYMPRFGVILEAYLKGCGESMLTRFTDQVEMQSVLEEIGEVLKKDYGKDYGKMQASLPAMLEAKSLQKFEITPVFNPKCRLGNLKPSKCKVMASAKMGRHKLCDWLVLRLLSLFYIGQVTSVLYYLNGERAPDSNKHGVAAMLQQLTGGTVKLLHQYLEYQQPSLVVVACSTRTGGVQRPMWLELYNIYPTALTQAPIRLILKQGDDLRQDMITLRMLSLFERLWEEQGLDLELIPYGCMATGPRTGFIEVVKNAKTIAEVSSVSDNKKLYEWIKSHQTNEFGETDPDKEKAAVRRFTVSCAGYSVATYILGIGDRHNDNIMVTTSGNLFHIDFGHFLGNIKYYMGFKREWAPFVLTPDFLYVMGGEGSEMFELYKRLCCRAFLTLRRHADLIFNLFSMMRSTGIPELTCVEDTDYIRMALVLDRSEHEAEEAFRDVIKKCLDLKWTVQVMWKFHDTRKNWFVGSSSS